MVIDHYQIISQSETKIIMARFVGSIGARMRMRLDAKFPLADHDAAAVAQLPLLTR